jgi:NAD(P)-dependent dehydrogenase (short-subunit alcohol dehydrogenase family)
MKIFSDKDVTMEVDLQKPLKNGFVSISGALRSIGGTIAKEPGSRGATLGLAGVLSEQSAAPFLKECLDASVTPQYCKMDVSQADEVNAWIAAAGAEVVPGYADAGRTGEGLKANPKHHTVLTDQTPIERLLQSDEIPFHVANLCDSRSSGITGATLLIDGGLSLRIS